MLQQAPLKFDISRRRLFFDKTKNISRIQERMCASPVSVPVIHPEREHIRRWNTAVSVARTGLPELDKALLAAVRQLRDIPNLPVNTDRLAPPRQAAILILPYASQPGKATCGINGRVCWDPPVLPEADTNQPTFDRIQFTISDLIQLENFASPLKQRLGDSRDYFTDAVAFAPYANASTHPSGYLVANPQGELELSVCFVRVERADQDDIRIVDGHVAECVLRSLGLPGTSLNVDYGVLARRPQGHHGSASHYIASDLVQLRLLYSREIKAGMSTQQVLEALGFGP